jgi:hypothetical protein
MSVTGTPASGSDSPASGSLTDASPPEPTEPLPRGPARWVGTWTVGRLDPRVVKALTVLGFAIPVVGYLVLLQHYQENAIVGDQWDDIPVIRQSYIHFPDWSSLWGLHNSNRIFFPNLIVVALAHTARFNITVELYFSAIMLFAATALLIWAHKRRSPDTPLLLYCPVAFLTLTIAQWQNTLWGFQMAWYLVLLSLAATILLLDRPTLAWPTFLAAAIVAVVGSYSSTQGLLIWPVGVLLLYLRRRPRWTLVSWIAGAGATAALYFYNFVSTGRDQSPSNTFDHLFTALKFYLYALGDIVGVQPHPGVPDNGAVMLFGVVVFALAVLVLFKWGLRRDEDSGVPIGIALIVFGLLFDALVTESRVVFGLSAAAQSRYSTNDILVLVGIYMTTISGLPSSIRAQSGIGNPSVRRTPHGLIARVSYFVERIDRGVIRRVAITAIVIQVVCSVHFGPPGARGFQTTAITDASLTRNINHESDATVSYGVGIFLGEPAQWFRDQTQFLREHHLSMFG